MEKQQELSEILFKAIKAASSQGQYDAVAKLSQEWRILNGLNFAQHVIHNPWNIEPINKSVGGV
jgi:hypothetical protein